MMKIEGAISVKAAINAKRRTVSKVFIDKGKKTKDFNYIRRRCKENNIEVEEMSREELDVLSDSKSYGGIIAEVSNRKEDDFEDGDIFYLNGIEDPFNLGYALRTLYAFGFKNVLLSSRDYSSMEPQLLKSSAGAYDFINVKIVKDENRELLEYKNQGYHFYGLYRKDDSKDIFEEEFKHKSFIILGGEKRGISSEVMRMVDDSLYIPYGSDFRNALNACGALDVVATLLFRKRKQ